MKQVMIPAILFMISFFSGELNGQSLQMFFTEPSGYPYMTTGFKLFDAQGNEIRNSPTLKPIKKGNIVIYETSNYGTTVQREVLADPDCPSQTLNSFSAVLIVDISESMNMDENRLSDGALRIDAVKEVLKVWARSFDPKRTETAITAFCGDAMPSTRFPDGPVRTFTTDKDSLLLAIDEIPDMCSGANYNAAFLYKRFETFVKQYSALYWCQPNKAKYKPLIVFLTDGNHMPQYGGPINGGAFNIDEVIRLANERNVSIYVIVLGDEEITPENREHLILLSYVGKAADDITDNIWWNVNSANELKGIYQEILNEAGRLGYPTPCYIPWKGGCEGGSATFTFIGAGPDGTDLVGVSDYMVAQNKMPYLTVEPESLNFNSTKLSQTSTQEVTIKATKNFVEVESIEFLEDVNGSDRIQIADWGSCEGLPFVLEKDSSCKLVVKYFAKDENQTSAKIKFNSSACDEDILNITATPVTGVDEHFTKQGGFKILPNPAEDHIKIIANNAMDNKVQIVFFDILGNVKLKLDNANLNKIIDITNLGVGTYFVGCFAGNKTEIIPLLIRR